MFTSHQLVPLAASVSSAKPYSPATLLAAGVFGLFLLLVIRRIGRLINWNDKWDNIVGCIIVLVAVVGPLSLIKPVRSLGDGVVAAINAGFRRTGHPTPDVAGIPGSTIVLLVLLAIGLAVYFRNPGLQTLVVMAILATPFWTNFGWTQAVGDSYIGLGVVGFNGVVGAVMSVLQRIQQIRSG